MGRTRIAGAALAGLLTVGVAATAVAAPAAKTVKVPPLKQTCTMSFTELIPVGETAINPADTQGSQFGQVTCGKKLGQGVESMTFTVPDDGSLTGAFRDFFGTDTLRGTYTMIPDTGQPTSTDNFSYQRYTGTIALTGGTGILKGATGTGDIRCVTTDAVHMNCVQHMKLKLAQALPKA